MQIPERLLSRLNLTKSSTKTDFGDLFGAFPTDDRLTFRLCAPRELGVYRPSLEFYRDSDGERLYLELEMTSSPGEIVENYSASVDLLELCPEGESDALLWYTAIFDSGYGRLRLSQSMVSYKPRLSCEWESYDGFQLTISHSDPFAPSKWAGGMIYHVFVDRFAKGNVSLPVREDAILDPDWEGGIPEYAERRGGFVRNNKFFGGNLWGVIDELDYLSKLGVSLIYLSPIFEAYSNHKYDTGDYMKVDEMFGGDVALKTLISKASKRGIGVILDGVFNHTGSDSIYFNKSGRYGEGGAYRDKNSPYFDWYDFTDHPDKYRCWWGIDVLPAVDTKNPDYTDFICGEDGVIAKYMNMGIAGWRLDVADELDDSFLAKLCKRVKTCDENAPIFGEVWEDASNKSAYGTRRKYFRGDRLDSVMNYPLRNGIIKFVKYGDRSELFEATALLYSHYPKSASDLLMNFLGTHDTERILTVLVGEDENGRSGSELASAKLSPEQRAYGLELLKICAILIFTLPGLPTVYYGDEGGMEGYRDPFNRMPFVKERQDRSLVSFYKQLSEIRRSEPLFSGGLLEVIENLPEGVFAFRRFAKGADHEILVAVNVSDKTVTLEKIENVGGEELISGETVNTCHLLPKSGQIIRKFC